MRSGNSWGCKLRFVRMMQYTLNDICSVITDGSHFSPEDEGVGYPMLSVKDMGERDFDLSACKHVGEEAFQKLLANGCKPKVNDVVVAKDGSYLKTAFSIKEDRDIALLSSIAILRPKPEIVSPDYLSYFLKSPSVYHTVSLNYISGTALKRVILKGIKKIQIELPPLEEQRYRAILLDNIGGIIQRRRQQLSALDDLIKARFVEIFGDPVSNPKGWEKKALSEEAEIKIGPFGSLLHKEDYISGGHALINPSHIVDGKIVPDDKLTISDEKYAELSAYHLRTGDVVMGRRGEMGRCAVVEQPGLLCGTGSLLIRTNGDLSADYIQKIISFPSFKRTIEDMAIGQTMPNLNVPIVSAFQIIKPPKSIQNQYYAFVSQVDKSKAVVQKALNEAQLLFDSLMQKYFG